MELSDYEDIPEAEMFRVEEAVRDQLVLKLRGSSDEALLWVFASLTHRLHVADRKKADNRVSLRIQRNVVEGEILRRMRRE